MKYKCITADQFETWLSVDKVYEAEIVVSPKEYSGGQWLLLKRADDGFTTYAKLNQFIAYRESKGDDLPV